MSPSTETPVLGDIRRLSMRRETIKALAERSETVVQERRQSKAMQTLGAKKVRPGKLISFSMLD